MRQSAHPDKYRAKTAEEVDMYVSGIPSQYWPTNTRKADFILVHDDDRDIHVEPGIQQKFYKSLLTEDGYFQDPYYYVFSSTRDNHFALTLAYEVLKKARRDGHRVQISDAQSSFQEGDGTETVHLIHNVFDDDPIDVISTTRRLLSEHSGAFRMLVTSGDPLKLTERLRLQQPDGYFYTNSTKVLQR